MDVIQVSSHRNTQFTLALWKNVSEKTMEENAVFSPVSIAVALSMAAAGSKGLTREQFSNCLKLQEGPQMHHFSSLVTRVLADGSPNGGPSLSFANGVWVEQSMGLKPIFKQITSRHYFTEARPVDFVNKANASREEVNKWAAHETKGKIQEVLPDGSVDASTRLILANALYFKGKWEEPFKSSDTTESCFYLLNGGSVQVPTMTTSEKQFITRVDDYKILRLPYSQGGDGRSFAMYIILPNERNGLSNLEKKMDLNFLQTELRLVDVGLFKLPRFKISFGFELPEILKEMGLVLPFSEGAADFSGMADSPLYISNAFHKAFTEVNEEGTEAAAGTVIALAQCAYPVEDFVADHPFMFVIKEDESGVVLFVGHVVNPSAE
eukprot:Gb_00302 [translate_table: standard]